MLSAKNLQFSSNPADILFQWLAQGWIILVEYLPNWMKIAVFYQYHIFEPVLFFTAHTLVHIFGNILQGHGKSTINVLK